MTLAIPHCYPGPTFQPIAEAHVVYVYAILLFILTFVTKDLGHCSMPARRQKEKYLECNGMSKWSFRV